MTTRLHGQLSALTHRLITCPRSRPIARFVQSVLASSQSDYDINISTLANTTNSTLLRTTRLDVSGTSMYHDYLQQRMTQHIITRLLLIKDLLQIYSSSTLSETKLLSALMPIATSLEPHTRRKTNCSQPQSLGSEAAKAYCFAMETTSDTTLGK